MNLHSRGYDGCSNERVGSDVDWMPWAYLHEGFVSGMIDFWTDSYRCEQNGLFVIDFSAQKYELEDGTDIGHDIW